MNSLVELISNEATSGIEGLTGAQPHISLEGEANIDASIFDYPLAQIDLEVSGDADGIAYVFMGAQIATILGDMMLGGEGEAKEELDEGDLDASKEIVSTIFGAVNTSLAAGGDLPALKFDTTSIRAITDSAQIDLSQITKMYNFEVSLNDTNTHIFLGVSSDVEHAFENDSNALDLDDDFSLGAMDTGDSGFGMNMMPSMDISTEEMKNMNLIMDVKLPIKVRIGSKKMLLKDVINMDIGAIIELDRLVNDPLDILVDDKVIGKGEVVIVDGNFGIQVSEIGSKKDRLEAMK